MTWGTSYVPRRPRWAGRRSREGQTGRTRFRILYVRRIIAIVMCGLRVIMMGICTYGWRWGCPDAARGGREKEAMRLRKRKGEMQIHTLQGVESEQSRAKSAHPLSFTHPIRIICLPASHLVPCRWPRRSLLPSRGCDIRVLILRWARRGIHSTGCPNGPELIVILIRTIVISPPRRHGLLVVRSPL